MNPRRSSRAHPNPPPSAAMQPTNSTSSSNSAGRGERSTRSNNKDASSRRPSTQQRSQSIDEAALSRSHNESTHSRHTQRGRNEDDADPPLTNNYDDDEEEDGDEEEITRCICGQQDYPGLPAAARSRLARSSAKSSNKEDVLQNAAADPLAEEPGSLFIQCDSCKVWQHGGCVGIMDEATCPEEYFCEECRKELHKMVVDAKGNKSSLYTPLVAPPSPSPPSPSPPRDNSKNGRDKKSKNNAALSISKRRSTMNSRDAAYDEEELLRRAIEESKGENKSTGDAPGSRKNKRTRSDSDVNKQGVKRRRTGSPSPSANSKESRTNSQPDSEDETKSKASSGNGKKTRATAARNQREKESQMGKGNEKDTELETAARRKGRSDRRKGDEPDAADTSPTKAAPNSANRTPSAPETPDPAAETGTSKTATRKSGRPARRGRVGRNQYTRDRDNNGGEVNGNSPRRGQSRDGVGANGDSPTGSGHTGANGVHLNGGESGKPSRPRHMNPNRTSMNDMRKRVAGILEFISRMQVEMAASGEQATPPNGQSSSSITGGEASGGKDTHSEKNSAVASAVSLAQGIMGDQAEALVNGDSTEQQQTDKETEGEDPPKTKDFKDLSSVEMMDVLTRGLLKWQQEYGKYGEK